MDYLVASTGAIAAGFCLDLLIGDPQGWPHLVRGFGWLLTNLEKRLYKRKRKLLSGIWLVLITLLVCGGIPAAALYGAWRISPWAYGALETVLCWQLLAIKSLRVESGNVYTALIHHDLQGARKCVSMIVGRDTDSMDEAAVIRAAVETVAENTSDGVIAPLFYLMLGGAALGCLYKAANTMDSMIGYKNDRYMAFGKCAAKLDDVLNFLPSRLCAVLMILSAWICGFHATGALCIWRRDRMKHESPNSAQTEAVMAGALGVRLAGNASYLGVLHEKPYIGDDQRPIEPKDILRSQRMLYATAILMLLLVLLFRGCVYGAI